MNPMNTNGYIKLHRSLLDWEWYADKNTSRMFLHILLRANFVDAIWRKGITVKRGSLITSVQALAQETGLTVSQTRRTLNHLQDSKEITLKTTNKYTVITVVKYDFYQGQGKCDDKQNGNQDGNQSDKQITNNSTIIEKIEEIKKKEYTSAEADEKPRAKVDYQHVVDVFNSICTSLPKVQSLNDRRKKAIKSASQTVEDFGGWEKLFQAVEQSDFLTGRSGAWSGCGFDWILKPANLVKIIEGNYTDGKARKDVAVYGDNIDIGTTF